MARRFYRIRSNWSEIRLLEDGEQSCVNHIGIYYEILNCLISELVGRFSPKSCEIFKGIAAFCPNQQSFLREEDLIRFAVA